jgi:hypothetical protein
MPAWILEALKPKPPDNRPRNCFQQAGAREASPALVQGRIKGLIAMVATAPEGERSSRLYWAARRFVEMCNEGVVDDDCAKEILIEAARYAGHPDHRSESTIQSAFRAGRQQP